MSRKLRHNMAMKYNISSFKFDSPLDTVVVGN